MTRSPFECIELPARAAQPACCAEKDLMPAATSDEAPAQLRTTETRSESMTSSTKTVHVADGGLPVKRLAASRISETTFRLSMSWTSDCKPPRIRGAPSGVSGGYQPMTTR